MAQLADVDLQGLRDIFFGAPHRQAVALHLVFVDAQVAERAVARTQRCGEQPRGLVQVHDAWTLRARPDVQVGLRLGHQAAIAQRAAPVMFLHRPAVDLDLLGEDVFGVLVVFVAELGNVALGVRKGLAVTIEPIPVETRVDRLEDAIGDDDQDDRDDNFHVHHESPRSRVRGGGATCEALDSWIPTLRTWGTVAKSWAQCAAPAKHRGQKASCVPPPRVWPIVVAFIACQAAPAARWAAEDSYNASM